MFLLELNNKYYRDNIDEVLASSLESVVCQKS